MGLPPRRGGLEPLREIGPHVQPAVRRPAAQPLHRATDCEVDAQRGDVHGNDPRRLVAVEDHVGADLVGSADDRVDVLDLRLLEQHVADRHEEGALVDPRHDLLVVLADDDLEVGLGLVQVAHRREVGALVDDAVSRGIDRPEAREHDRLGNRNVLLHHRRSGRCADDPPDLVADPHRRRPPPLGPGADPTLGPHPGELGQQLGRTSRHRPERVAREVRRALEDRELGAVVEKLAHPLSVDHRGLSARRVGAGPTSSRRARRIRTGAASPDREERSRRSRRARPAGARQPRRRVPRRDGRASAGRRSCS